MRAKDVVGRKIAGLQQSRVWNEASEVWEWDLRAILLDNGGRISLFPSETHDTEPHILGTYVPPEG